MMGPDVAGREKEQLCDITLGLRGRDPPFVQQRGERGSWGKKFSDLP